MAGRQRTFDYEAARVRYQAGESQSEIARSLGVSGFAISRAISEERRLAANAATIRSIKKKRKPCLGGCGRLVWMHTGARTGYCTRCLTAKRREERVPQHGTETEYSAGCRCDACRGAATRAKAERRARSAPPCVGGCGTMVPTINRDYPDKPVECRACAIRRINAERQAVA